MNNIEWVIICIISFILGIYFAKWYIERLIKKKISEVETLSTQGPVNILQQHSDYINGKFCYNTKYLQYPFDEFPLSSFTSKNCYSPDIARFLLTLCENVGTINCSISPLELPGSFSNTYTLLYVPGQNPCYGGVFYDTSTKTTILVWSGTSDLKMSKKDVETIPVPFPPSITSDSSIKVHRGFLSVYLRTKSLVLDGISIYPESEHLVITGNSLGGGISYISAYDILGNNLTSLPTLIYTFGSPRAGNIEFADAFNLSESIQDKLLTNMRIFNTEDLVPTVPPPAPKIHFSHIGTQIPFTYNSGTVIGNHIPGYLKNLPTDVICL